LNDAFKIRTKFVKFLIASYCGPRFFCFEERAVIKSSDEMAPFLEESKNLKT